LKRTWRSARAVGLLPLLCLLTSVLAVGGARAHGGQSRGSVAGVVKDGVGAPVSRAEVSLVNAQQIVFGKTETDADGRFRFTAVPAGSYAVLVSKPEFSRQREAAHVTQGGAVELIITLEVSRLSEEVTVTAETGLAERRERVPQQVNVIPESAIGQRATAVLAQVADEEVGASLQRTSPTIASVLVRGLTEVGVYVDGVRYTNSTQRGGINTFFNLNEPTSLQTVELLRGPNSAQYGSDSLGGTVQLVSRQPAFGFAAPEAHGEVSTFFTSADLSFGGNTLVTYGTERFGLLANVASRRINTLRPGGGVDSHSAVTRFLGLPSNVLGDERLPDTAFTQYGGTLHLTFAPSARQQFGLRYQRGQQDGGKRYDQLLGGDGNVIADLRNLMLDFLYGRYFKQGAGVFDNFSATVSYNSQREERVNQGGQGNALAAVTHDKERTSSVGFSFYLDKQLAARHSFLVGGDIYRDRVDAPSFTFEPSTGAATPARPRVPNGARYLLAGVYVQDAYEAVANRLRLSGALRYNVASYRSRAAHSPLVNGQPLFPDDSLRAADFSGRIGAVATVADGVNVAFNYSRGFRAPNITNLGSLGLVGVGFQVATADVLGLGATIGSTADESAVSTGVAVAPLKSEISDNYDLSLRFRRGRVEWEATGFFIDYANAIVRQTLILPPGAVGRALGSQRIERQNANGAVFVPLATAPVLTQANFGGARLKGFEFDTDVRLTKAWTLGGNYTYVRAEDRLTGAPPNLGGGGLPPQTGFLRLRYQPPSSRHWVEAYSTLAGRQDRLSTLDLADRRTGAARSRANIQNFFRRGACVYGLTTPGTTGQCGSAGGTLIPTGETLAEVQNRMLGGAQSAPLFTAIPGYGLVNVRGGFRLNESQAVTVDFENIIDKSHRAPGWGVDGPGRSVTVRYQFKF
jgi:hemoglobin/transferrin/lactoferrin receptor protein